MADSQAVQQPAAIDGKEEQRPTGRKNERAWKKPVLEDVSGKVMAQPYIRFT